MPKIKGARRFLIFTQPHLGDPQWVTPVVELEDHDDPTKPATPIEYKDMVVLEQVVLQLSRDRARAAGFNAGAQTVLDTFDLTAREYFEKVKANKANKESKSAEKLDTQGGSNDEQNKS